MVFSSYNPILTLILLISPSPLYCNIDHAIDLDTQNFIQNICNKTRKSDSCKSIFIHNLPKPETDPEGLTWVAIDQMLKVLYESVDYIQSEKKKMIMLMHYEYDEESINLDIIRSCGWNYLATKMGVEEARKKVIDLRNVKSLLKVGEIFGDIHELAHFEIGKCENIVNKSFGNLFLDLSLFKGIMERNQIISLLLEMVIGAAEILLKVMDIGAGETEFSYGFMQFLFHTFGWFI